MGLIFTNLRKSRKSNSNGRISEEQAVAIEVTQDLKSFEYGMNQKHRGLAIIFNQCKLDGLPSKKRVGAEQDVVELKKRLPSLGFQEQHIIIETDLTKSEILNYSNKLVRDILKNSDCIAIFILSHGFTGNNIYAKDDFYELYELVEKYTATNLKQLAAKPKLFFVDVCHYVNEGDKVLTSNYSPPNTCEVPNTRDFPYSGLWQLELRPHNADILISHSSYHERESNRNDNGSWYIQDLCTSIRKYKTDNLLETTDITELLTHTNFLTSQRTAVVGGTTTDDGNQCPTYNSGLSRKLYFKKCKPLL